MSEEREPESIIHILHIVSRSKYNQIRIYYSFTATNQYASLIDSL